MAYGTLKVDNLTYTSGGSDASVTVSGIVGIAAGNFTNVTATNTISGATITGNVGEYTTFTAVSGIFKSQVSGQTVTGNAGNFTALTGSTANFTQLTGGSAGFTTVTGATVTGITANFVSGVYTTQISGTFITGNTSAFTSVTGGIGKFVTGIFNSGVAVTGYVNVSGYYVSNVRPVDALEVSCTSGNYFTKTITGNSTFTVANVPATGAYAFTMEVQHSGGTITWFSGVQWPSNTAPTLTSGKTHLFFFVTDDGGTRWRGSSLVDYTT